MCLLKAFLCNTSVSQTKEHPRLLCTDAHGMLCFTCFCLIIDNKMHPQQLHSKQIIDLLRKQKCVGAGIVTIWYNIYGCAEHYICATALYLLSILSQSYNIIIDRGISAPGHVREVVDLLNATYKKFIFHLISTVQLPGIKRFDTQMEVQTATQNTDMSLAPNF